MLDFWLCSTLWNEWWHCDNVEPYGKIGDIWQILGHLSKCGCCESVTMEWMWTLWQSWTLWRECGHCDSVELFKDNVDIVTSVMVIRTLWTDFYNPTGINTKYHLGITISLLQCQNNNTYHTLESFYLKLITHFCVFDISSKHTVLFILLIHAYFF